MQYNYDFYFHHQLVDPNQMLREFESFFYYRNVHNGSWYGKPNFLHAPYLIMFVDSQILGKGFLIVLKNINGRKIKFLFLYPHSEKTSGPMSNKVDVVKFLQYIMT